MKRFRSGLALKLVVCLVVSTAAFFGLFGYLNLRLQRRHFEQMVVASAERLSDIIQGSARHEMMANDRASLYDQIRDMGEEPGISLIRIFNKEGFITYSTNPKEVGTTVDKGAEACYGCHSQQAPLAKLNRPDRARIFRQPDGSRVLAVIRPVENRKECSQAACHAHSPSRRILGVIDAHLSLAAVDSQLTAQRSQLLAFTALAMGFLSLLSVVFVWAVVHRPVKELVRGTEKVAGGDLSYRLKVSSNDELGALAASFNKMTRDLASAHEQLTEWAHTLEERVKRKTGELERAHASLVSSEKMASIGKLAATVAHEVNNPLFGMLTYARLTLKALQNAPVEESAKTAMAENLRVIERESRRCGDLMKNLLAFARQAPPSRSVNDINTLVERAVSLVRHQYELQEIELTLQLAKDVPAVTCDPGQIQQVLVVLLVNASEAMPSGGEVSVTTEGCDAGAAVCVRVRDSGPGIPADILQQIFEPFFTTKEDQHRTGLGLAVARGIVERHSGRIEVVSTPGAGAEFIVTLPVDSDQPAEEPAAAPGMKETP